MSCRGPSRVAIALGSYARLRAAFPTFEVSVGSKGLACGIGDDEQGLAILYGPKDLTDERRLRLLSELLLNYEILNLPPP